MARWEQRGLFLNVVPEKTNQLVPVYTSMDLTACGFLDTNSIDESDGLSSPPTPARSMSSPKLMTGDQCCHHFQSQNVFTSEHEPLVLCATEDTVFLATHLANGNCQIEVRCMSDPGCPVLHTFSTVTPVKSITYNKEGKYIATLEEKRRGTQRDTFTHVYINWDIVGDNQPLKARVAGKIKDFTEQTDRLKSMEVIEILTKHGPNCIACCEKTGNIAISWQRSVTIFKYVAKLFHNEQYKDFVRVMEVDFTFQTLKCCLSETFLAVCSDDSVQVVRLKFEEKDRRPHSMAVGQYDLEHSDTQLDSMWASYEKVPSVVRIVTDDLIDNILLDSYEIIDAEETVWSFPDEDVEEKDRPEDTVNPPSIKRTVHVPGHMMPKTVRLPTLEAAVEADAVASKHRSLEICGPRSSVPGQNVKLNVKDKNISTYYEVTASTLLFRRFPMLMDSRLHTIQLLPVYEPESTDPTAAMHGFKSLNPLKSLFFNKLVSLCCFISNQSKGYLYNILGEVDLICSYNYAEPTSNVALTDTLVHTVTSKGLLTYTGRHFVPALHKLQTFDNNKMACPPRDIDVCLFGTQPFIGIESICLTNSHVVLLNKVQDENNSDEDSWSMYALKSSSVVVLCTEVHELTSSLRNMSPADHLHLLQESQLLIQHAMLHGIQEEGLDPMFRTCCTMLGDYYAMPDREDCELTIPYYTMSGVPAEDIIKRHYVLFFGDKGHELADLTSPVEYGEGLAAYIVHVLFDGDDLLDVEEGIGDFVLALVAAKRTKKLAEVIAVSRLKNFSRVHAEKLLRQLTAKLPKNRPLPFNVIVHAILKLHLGEPHDAKVMLSSLSKDDIVTHCSKHHRLLHNDLSTWTDIAQLLRLLHHQAFTKILVNLLDNKVLGLNQTIDLLKGPEEGVANNGNIREYLEEVLTDEERKYHFTDAAGMLCKIYISNLKSWEAPSMRTPEKSHVHISKGDGHFAKRYPWLDDLPPFSGQDSGARPCLYLRQVKGSPPRSHDNKEICCCCCCNEDLLKLQSLLCSSHATQSLHHQILYDLKDSPEVKGQTALQILCQFQTDSTSATDQILDNFPAILPQFGEQMFGKDTNKWSSVSEKIAALLKTSDNEKETNMAYMDVYKRLLSKMAEILPVKDFLRILPSDGNLSFFVPYLEKSFRSSATFGLKEKIMRNGEALYGGFSQSWGPD